MFDTNILLKCKEIILHEYLMQFWWIGWGGGSAIRMFVCLCV